MDQALLQMYHRVLQALEGAKYANRDTPVFAKTIEWVKGFPPSLDVALKRRLIDAACKAFDLSEADLWMEVDGAQTLATSNGQPRILVPDLQLHEDRFRNILPKNGWYEWFDLYTKGTEIPLSYSVFSSLCAVGAALGRRVWLRMGHFSIYPNYCVILIGPPGLKKSTAGDIVNGFIKELALCPTLADSVTPERMITVLKESGHHFIYVGEMSTFFGKQKYNEGLVTKMLRILDSPSEYIAETVAREQEILQDLAVSFLGCTTPSLLAHSMPEEVTSSGFMSRFVLVVEKDTHREFHIPEAPDPAAESKIRKQLRRLKGMVGEMKLTPQANEWYKEWYHSYKERMRTITDETIAEIQARSPIHVLRTGMLTHLLQCDDFNICPQCLESASKLIGYTEASAPRTVQSIKQTAGATDMDYVFSTLLKLGGAADHSTMVRRTASRMNAQVLRGHMKTLEEAGRVKIGKTPSGGGTYYMVTDKEET